MNAKEYAEQLAQAAGLADDDKAALLKVVGNDKVAKSLEENMLLRADYSRNMDALKAQEKKNSDYYQTLVTWKQEQDAATVQPVIQAVQPDLTQMEKKFNDRLTQQEGQFIGLLKVGMNLASRHAVEFKEPLDTEAVEKLAVEKQLPLAQAYEQYVGPRRAASQEEARKAELAAARADGAREFASTHKIPIDTGAREGTHILFDRGSKTAAVTDYVAGSGQLSPQANATLEGNFAESWNSAQRARTSGT